MSSSPSLLALDVGEKRIGVAIAEGSVRIAIPHDTIQVDGKEIQSIAEMVCSNDITTIVIGYPRNQSGEPTKQTAYVEAFAEKLADIDAEIAFQDESLTSVLAKEHLEASGRPYAKEDVDAMAASIILTDYIERN